MKKIKLVELKNQSPLSSEKFDFIAGELFNFSPEKLFFEMNTKELSPIEINKLKKTETLVETGTPPQYIFKKADFYGSNFYVNKNVLIPRPETELLIDMALNFLRSNHSGRHSPSVLDLGTGSGCIAIIIKKFFPESVITASDHSKAALKIAERNAKEHKVKINFIHSNLFDKIDKKFDLIVANLPYGDPADPDYQTVADPKIATNGGKQGIELIEKSIKFLDKFLLTKNALAIFEIGYDQGKLIKKIAEEKKLTVEIVNDLNDFDRFALIKLG